MGNPQKEHRLRVNNDLHGLLVCLFFFSLAFRQVNCLLKSKVVCGDFFKGDINGETEWALQREIRSWSDISVVRSGLFLSMYPLLLHQHKKTGMQIYQGYWITCCIVAPPCIYCRQRSATWSFPIK